ncbi:5-dehydro-4-deoxy-D-glucuronate isomerase [Cellulomonas fimi]|uniref:4-deoxy-L-threo-5-hexosulose-uronate ketol-isomerase n=1 Tax=Cellulomonas fimi (strain ATCC 484 / DSM 20113 / JCM 1341 / CCUG 24087 / LMG 16345 / NBRC 15513 / NCIMB 8980 / NCTC 7547 / NRS-133) TaxID=590998 RepID=F4H1N9_CELFA|nr:5-dehydro-4-deoxy-D-glucuronate isomerase [Cellulomonas fimi]AEE47459.1 4-deoxy-L-threo-5-hexosulose-uronate ketol-isomerase [Cellulomonas fimi ATCC 484]NNH05564.1 5-dehydro-4-deoxy-D-glucuronate isomerase [Cellulomonas fimi]VEH36282.1 4-deoxy-L-threo-5-hexosulose-uronate ketol-isomerase [Cellulomonas fimi]
MDLRYATSPEHVPGMDTDELRRRFLVQDLFADDEARAVYTHHDRVVLVGVVPASAPVTLPTFPEIRSEHFFDHREAGIVNVGGPGTVTVDGAVHHVDRGACLYVGRGARDVVLASTGAGGADGPARFYLFSAPAHTAFPTTLVEPGGGTVRELGDALTSNRRTLTQYIHEDGVRSCQVVMGVTRLHPGSMWNTMPAHTHDRRTEVYLYVDVPDDARVVHLLGEPTETRHLLVANHEAVIAPSWSVHSGVGTASYGFVWAMAGENQSFDDMDGHPITDMR